MEKHNNCGSHNTNETCSPLCSCDCCSVIIVSTDVFQLQTSIRLEIVDFEENYIHKHESQFYEFWHPPRA